MVTEQLLPPASWILLLVKVRGQEN